MDVLRGGRGRADRVPLSWRRPKARGQPGHRDAQRPWCPPPAGLLSSSWRSLSSRRRVFLRNWSSRTGTGRRRRHECMHRGTSALIIPPARMVDWGSRTTPAGVSGYWGRRTNTAFAPRHGLLEFRSPRYDWAARRPASRRSGSQSNCHSRIHCFSVWMAARAASRGRYARARPGWPGREHQRLVDVVDGSRARELAATGMLRIGFLTISRVTLPPRIAVAEVLSWIPRATIQRRTDVIVTVPRIMILVRLCSLMYSMALLYRFGSAA